MPKVQKKPHGLEIGSRCSLKICSKHPILRLITKRCSDQPSDPMKIVIGGRNYKFWDEVVELQCPDCGSKHVAIDEGQSVEDLIERRILAKKLPLVATLIDDPTHKWPKKKEKPGNPLRIDMKQFRKTLDEQKEKPTPCCHTSAISYQVKLSTDANLGSDRMIANAYFRIVDRIRIRYSFCGNCLELFYPAKPMTITRSEFVALKVKLWKETGIRIMASDPEKLIQLRNT